MKTETQKAVKVPMEVEWQPAWLSWVGATTSCLRALGLNCDKADVAGMCGYAFVMSVHEKLCPSGPTVFSWETLLSGVSLMGRSTLNYQSGDCYIGDFRNDRTREHCRIAFDLVQREIEEGRPCVIWGAYVPEFAVAIGIQERSYIVKSFRECTGEEQPPIPWDALEAPGGPYVLGFPSRTPGETKPRHDKWAIQHGVRLLTEDGVFEKYASGLSAYDMWIEALKANRAEAFGNAYNAQCWAEAKIYAREFLKRIADRNPKASEILRAAASHYEDVTKAMDAVAKLFPFPPGPQIEDESTRRKACEALSTAKAAEIRAVDNMRKSLAISWD